MASANRRHRSSTAASIPSNTKSFVILRGLLDGLSDDLERTLDSGYPDTAKLAKGLRAVSEHIASASTTAPQDDFRHAGGFEFVLNILRRFSGFYDPAKRTEAELLSLFKLLGQCLNVLSTIFRKHTGNRRFFRYRVEGGGWEALEQVIASIGLGGAEPDPWVSCRVFGKLLAFALDDEALDLLCQSIAKTLRPEADTTSQTNDDDSAEEQWDLVLARSIENIGPSVREVVNSKSVFAYPEILRVIVNFWTSIPRTIHTSASPGSLIVLETILCATSTSIYNRAAAHSTRILSQFLRVAFGPNSHLAAAEQEKLIEICKTLMFLGVNEPADTQYLLLSPGPEAAEFCLEMMSKYSGPPFFHFDLSLLGHCSLELPSLGRPFPPQSAAGYTFTAWIRVDNFDPNAHTTLFGVFD
jgi:hypothetical protein